MRDRKGIDQARFARGHHDPDFEEYGFGRMGPGRRFGGPGRGPGRGRGRARRGDVRAAVLALLAEKPMHGYEMIQVLEERTNGVWRPSPGSIYPTLQMLEDEGLVRGDGSSGKQLFTLTDAGRDELAKEPERRAPWDEVTDGIDPSDLQMRQVVRQIGMAVRQVAEAGSSPQKAKAVEVLSDARRALYAILAEGE